MLMNGIMIAFLALVNMWIFFTEDHLLISKRGREGERKRQTEREGGRGAVEGEKKECVRKSGRYGRYEGEGSVKRVI